jgi:hypothetical protein
MHTEHQALAERSFAELEPVFQAHEGRVEHR